MTFQEAQQRYAQLAGQWRAGQLDPQAFAGAVAELRVQDASGRWWTLEATTGGWLVWDGSSWVAGRPPVASPAPPAPQTAPAYAAGAATAAAVPGLKTAIPMSTQDFMREAKGKPLAQRSEAWWNMLSILGGAASGVLWFLYSSIRGSYEGYDWITPILMVAMPIVLTVFRKPIDIWLLPLQKYRARFPRMILVGAGVAAPFVISWILYTIFRLRQYNFMHWSIILSTLGSYVILRTPRVGVRAQGGAR